jgi:predicted RND superfamily exporter protein
VLGSLLVGVWLTVGCAAWLNVRLNFLNFVALPLTFGIGVEYAINLYDRIRLYDGDIEKGVASAGGAVGLCSLTTILGYGSLLFADNQALKSFGKYAVFGEICCMVTALLIMPATIEAFRRRRGHLASPRS